MISKKLKKVCILVAATSLSLIMFVGCIVESKPVDDVMTQIPIVSETQEVIIEPLSIFYQTYPGVSLNDNPPIIDAIQNITKIDITWIEGSSDTDLFKQKFNQILSSDDIPDVISSPYIEDMTKAAQDGQFLAMEDIIKSDIPSFQYILNTTPYLKNILKSDNGHTYFLPKLSLVRSSKVFMVRQDWLDKLDLKKPTNLDDLYEVLKAFKEGDPNGNGLADEIPYVTRDKSLGLLYIAQSFGVYGFEAGFMVDGAIIKYPYSQLGMIEAIIYLNKLYSEGLIDQGYLDADDESWSSMITDSISGITYDQQSMIDSFTTMLRESNANAYISGFVPPLGANEATVLTESQNDIVKAVTAVSKSSDHKKTAAKLFDYMYSGNGSLDNNYGILDVHYTMEDNVPTYTDFYFNGDDTTNGLKGQSLLFRDGKIDLFAGRDDIRVINLYETDEVLAIREEYEYLLIEKYPNVTHTDEEIAIINEKYPAIMAYTDEMMINFIDGSRSIKYYDNFIEELEEMGILEVIAAKQAAYDRYINK